MNQHTRYRTPYDRPSSVRYLVIIAVVILLGASVDSHTMLEHDRRETGYQIPDTQSRRDADMVGNTVYFPNVANYLELEDPSLELYREPVTRDAVIDFFVHVAGAERVVVPVLEHAAEYGITPIQAFTIAFIESSYRTDVVNINEDPYSVDRGLFQLNNRSFPQLSNDDFFHPDTNSWYAMRHLRYAINRADGDYLTAVAIYNAGERRVLSGNTPESTQRYVRDTRDYRAQLIRRFRDYIGRNFPSEPTDIASE